MFNKLVLVGNLTRDIELRYSGSGSAIANTAIATSRKFTQNGERKEEVCFIDITFFGRSAEVANQFLRRGSKVLIEGRLKFDQWEDQNGKRSKHSVIVETMQMMDSKEDTQNQGQQAQQQAPQQQMQDNGYQQQNQNPSNYQQAQQYNQQQAPHQNHQGGNQNQH